MIQFHLKQQRTDPVAIAAINRRLNEKYRVLDGRPIYRVVWSEDQIETRAGEYSDFYGSIFIRTVKQVRDIKKYWYFSPRWVLEKLVFPRTQAHLKEMCLELVKSQNGSYEPVYSFKTEDEKHLPVSEHVIEMILQTLHNPKKMTQADADEEERLIEMAEMKYFEEKIGENERSPLFVWENSAFVSTEQKKFRQTYTETSKEPEHAGLITS